MPAFADISVMKNDGVTPLVYVGKSPAGGDSSQAVWRADSHLAPYAGLKPQLALSSRWNGAKTARRIQVDFAYHGFSTDTTTGVSARTGSIPFSTSCAIPQNLPQSDIDEAVAQYANLLKSALVQLCMKAGYSAT